MGRSAIVVASLEAAASASVLGCAPRTTANTTENIAVGPAASTQLATPRGPRWTPPSCPLRYELQTDERYDMHDADWPVMQLSMFATLDAVPDAAGVTLQVTPTIMLKRGKHRPYVSLDPSLPPLELATDGRRWRPRAPSALFAGWGTQGGLAWLFPDAPEGASGTWSFPVERRTLIHNGVYLYPGKGFDRIPTDQLEALPLRVEVSSSPDGQLVLQTRGREVWSYAEADRPTFDRKGEIRAEHVFTPEGRLLSAHIERDVTITSPSRSTWTLRGAARLVSACDGPTLPPSPPPTLTAEDRVIQTIGELSVAVYEGNTSTYADFFSSEVRRARGDKGIAASIERYRKQRGDRAWAIPLLIEDADVVKESGERVVVSVVGSTPLASSPSRQTRVLCRFEAIKEGDAWKLDRVSATMDMEPGDPQILEISKTRAAP